ncbi:MAG: Mov34/MPN/PAD-1 family protein [Dehalococcoidia bacterium]
MADHGVVFLRRNAGRIKLSKQVIAEMHPFAQCSPDALEAGGVLLGRHLTDSPDIVVDNLTLPMDGDVRRRHFFLRRKRNHQKAIDAAWRQSAGTCTYLGEWHTHPEPDPRPSKFDLMNWNARMCFDRHSGILFFVILGTRSIRIWEGRNGCRRPFLLQLQGTHGESR